MRTGKLLASVAIVCAVLLLTAPLSPRTAWTHERGTGMRHSAGWDWVAAMSGMVAIVALLVGGMARPGVMVPVLSAGAAAAAFGASAAAAAGHWVTLVTGAMNLETWVMRPAPHVGDFAAIAVAGGSCALILVGYWLHPGDGEW